MIPDAEMIDPARCKFAGLFKNCNLIATYDLTYMDGTASPLCLGHTIIVIDGLDHSSWVTISRIFSL